MTPRALAYRRTPSRQRRLFAGLVVIIGISGCSSVPSLGEHAKVQADVPLLVVGAADQVNSVNLGKFVNWGIYVGAAYLVLDPFNPNWDIEQAAFPENHYHLSLKMKRFYAGGAGESRAVFHKRAKDLMRRNGFDEYQILEYTESLGSSVLGSQRTAQGVIQLTRRPG